MSVLRLILSILASVICMESHAIQGVESRETESEVWKQAVQKFTAFQASGTTNSAAKDRIVLPIPPLEKPRAGLPWPEIGIALSLCLALLLSILFLIRRRFEDKNDNETSIEIIEFCESLDACDSMDEQRAMLTRLALRAEQHPLQTSPNLLPPGTNLSATELLLAALDYDDIPTNVTAGILGKTKGTVYNLRSSLRTKLDNPL